MTAPEGSYVSMTEAYLERMRPLMREDGGKIVLFVIDGLGGLPHPDRGTSEMEEASTPNLDRCAARASTGRVAILPPGFTPGSGPGHLSLFGYDPFCVDLGRGVLEALGCDDPLGDGEVAARGNFCTLDANGLVTDRRAGRPADEKNRELCARLQQELAGKLDANFRLLPGKEHRFTLVVGGEGFGARVNDNDPQMEGRAPLEFQGADAPSRKTATWFTEFVSAARAVLADEPATNGMLLRGISSRPELMSFPERYRLRAAACAIYPMYRGVARLCGMEMIEAGANLEEQIASVKKHWDDFDFFFIHTKGADQAGHGGEFAEKVRVFEEIDAAFPALEALGPDVLIVTGDHSTPCIHFEHSWHPVPCLVASNRSISTEGAAFSERGVMRGELGILPGPSLIPLALAHAGRLAKYGA